MIRKWGNNFDKVYWKFADVKRKKNVELMNRYETLEIWEIWGKILLTENWN